MELKSNIGIGQKIQIETQNGKPREIIKSILKELNEEKVLIGVIYVGRRVINTENLYLISGRRHRKYYGLKVNKKIYIKFCWYKIKKMTDQELNDTKQKWNFDFFSNEGSYLVEKFGGALSPNYLLYTKLKLKI